MHETTPIHIISQDEVSDKVAAGLLVPINSEENVNVIDCGDHRPLTIESAQQRQEQFGREVVPARYFGGAYGLALTTIAVLATQADEREIKGFLGGINAESFTDFAADLTNRAKLFKNIEVNQHSAAANEGNPLHIADDHRSRESPLGCALAHNIGRILHKASEPIALQDSLAISSECGLDLPVEALSAGANVLAKHVPKTLSMHRGALHHAITKSEHYTPIAILEDSAASKNSDELAVVIDLASYRSKPGVSRYHHTPDIASKHLPELFPEFELDEQLVAASGLLIGAATRAVLSGEETPHALPLEVIPSEYAAA